MFVSVHVQTHVDFYVFLMNKNFPGVGSTFQKKHKIHNSRK